MFDLSIHRGSWVVLFFYPGDFTLICPTELAAFAKRHDDFLAEDAVLLAASTNSCFSHKAWFETDPRLADVRYPVIADSLRELSRTFGVLQEDGTAHRGTFIIDPNGVLMHMSINGARRRPQRRRGAANPARVSHRGDVPGQLGGGRRDPHERGRLARKGVPDIVGPQLDSLGEQAHRVSFAAGDTIVAEGDPGGPLLRHRAR